MERAGFSLRLTIPIESTDGVVTAVPISAVSLAADGTSRVQVENEGALEYVERIRRTGDVVATVGLATIPYRDYYRTEWFAAETAESLRGLRATPATTWVVYTLEPHLESFHPQIHGLLQEECPVDARFEGTLGGGTVFVCRMDGPLSGPVELAVRKGLGWTPV